MINHHSRQHTTRPVEKLWSNQFILINLISLLFLFSEYILTTTVPLYAVHLGGDESTAGLFMSIISGTALIVRPIMGHAMDTISRKLVVILGGLALATAALFYGLATTIPLILMFAAIQGIAISAVTTAAPTVLVDVAPPSRMAEGVSMFGIALNMPAAIGPMAALFLLGTFSFKFTFGTSLLITMVVLGLTLLINYEKKKPRVTRLAGQKATKLDARTLFEKTALKPALYQVLMAFGSSVIYTFIPLYALSRRVDNIGLFFTLNAVSGILASYIAGRLVQKLGIRKVFFPALLMVLTGFSILAFARTLPLMLVAAVLYGFGNGIGFAIINIIGMELAPIERRGAANATLYAAMDIGIATGSIILGFIAARLGFTATFVTAAAVIILDLILFAFLNRELPGYGKALQASHVVMVGTEEINIDIDQ